MRNINTLLQDKARDQFELRRNEASYKRMWNRSPVREAPKAVSYTVTAEPFCTLESLDLHQRLSEATPLMTFASGSNAVEQSGEAEKDGHKEQSRKRKAEDPGSVSGDQGNKETSLTYDPDPNEHRAKRVWAGSV